MAEALHPDISAALASGRVIVDRAVAFNLPSGVYGLWTGEGLFQSAGIDFYGGKEGMVSISPVATSLDGMPEAMEVVLVFGNDDKFDPANLVNGIETEAYNGRPMAVYDCFFNPDTGALLGDIRQVWTGVIDTILHSGQGAVRRVTAIGEQKSQFDLTMAPQATRSDASQRLRNANDGFLRHVNGVRRPVYWGRATPSQVQ